MENIIVRIGTKQDWNSIHSINWQIYVNELQQHNTAPGVTHLIDRNHEINTYVVAESQEQIIGFLAITAFTGQPFSFEKRLPDATFVDAFRHKAIEVRLLSLMPEHRNISNFFKLGSFVKNWIKDNGYDYVFVSGIDKAIDLYKMIGFVPIAPEVNEGKVNYTPMVLVAK
ncbi:hypothetical protein MSP8887_00558 [Marinomonas spartinae]|uniref:GNAT family N-acetyltransferase n=1 Tax=Marinomonas spartinae TaxID=1792290 RepID=UPI000808D76D|nr:GNAT family N-acetyltransferase [Marinomonas spartinae]SBS27172.1 hypothetical protein MSP8887_00558 [Marinomonas spartinae]